MIEAVALAVVSTITTALFVGVLTAPHALAALLGV